jgi:NAD(P)-dependent dehydrogenase (short-subunit alcohol dehydrogenase family)
MEREPFSLSGKHALITGGGSGIGRAIARAFVKAGAYVTVTGRTESTLRDTVTELGPQAAYAVHDVTDTQKTVLLVAELESRRPVDILVNNAGRHQKLPTLETTDEAIRDVIDTNLLAVLSLSRECARHMVKRSGGSIVMVLSMASLFGIPQVSAYSAAKAGLAGLVRQLAVEWGPAGVRVNGIAPGFIDTAMSRKALDNDPARKARVLTRTPLGRLGAVEEVAESAVFLSAPSGSYITGVILPVDGGTSIGF